MQRSTGCVCLGEDNSRTLQLHMEATEEIAGMIARSMAEAEFRTARGITLELFTCQPSNLQLLVTSRRRLA